MTRGDRYKVLCLILGVVVLVYVIRDATNTGGGDRDMFFSRRVLRGQSFDSTDHLEVKKPNELIRMDKNVPIIWIGGVPRSGTTLSRAILDAHPDIRCGEETRVIPRMLFMHSKMQMSQIEKARLDEAKVTEDVLEYALGSYILSIIVKHGEPAARLCNKDPFTLKSMDLIMKIFPQSKFILMIRDGRAVAHSIVTRKITISGFDTKTYSGALRDWNRAIQVMYRKCLKMSHVCMPLWYEQLVIDPEPQMRKVLKFLDIPWNDIVLHHEQTIGKEGGISLSKRERSTDQVNKPVNTDALYKWIELMPKSVKDNAGSIAPMLKDLGYDPDNPIVNYGTKSDDAVAKEVAVLQTLTDDQDS
ncbi:protein-tyrosine sulfotransferase 1-like [Tubulanus polymorphus]|uniref:protein-tyrosine sulfotransferase 1-like n=1 Tax=Tubulanus polymorphus TaxID=672921 RepID=UPI003DA1DC47